MLRDITIGQYFPGHSFIHKMDPRMKIIAAVLYIVVLFVASRPLGPVSYTHLTLPTTRLV